MSNREVKALASALKEFSKFPMERLLIVGERLRQFDIYCELLEYALELEETK